MPTTSCPHCKEEIKKGARICIHCRERLHTSKSDLIMDTVIKRLQICMGVVPEKPTAVSDGAAFCYGRFGDNHTLVNQCLREQEEAEAIAAGAERLHRELVRTMAEIIWGGGDIDPIPFENAVRERFRVPR